MSSLDSWEAEMAEVERRDGRKGAGDLSRQGSDIVNCVRIPLVFELVRICDWDIILVIPLKILNTSLTRLRVIMVLLLTTTLLSLSVFSCVSLTNCRLARSWARPGYCHVIIGIICIAVEVICHWVPVIHQA